MWRDMVVIWSFRLNSSPTGTNRYMWKHSTFKLYGPVQAVLDIYGSNSLTKWLVWTIRYIWALWSYGHVYMSTLHWYRWWCHHISQCKSVVCKITGGWSDPDTHPTNSTRVKISAGLILGTSMYRDTSESSITILGGITILPYIEYHDILWYIDRTIWYRWYIVYIVIKKYSF